MYQAFTEDQIQIRDLVRDFTRKEITPVAHLYDEKNEHPKELIDRMRRELGINGLTIPVVCDWARVGVGLGGGGCGSGVWVWLVVCPGF